MAELPVISGREACKIFGKLGWNVERRGKGHIIMGKAGAYYKLSVPDHKKLDRGTLRSLIRDAGITVEAFNNALN